MTRLFLPLTSLSLNQLLCWSVSKCLRCNLMKANSHKGGKEVVARQLYTSGSSLYPPPFVGTLSLTSQQKKRAGSWSQSVLLPVKSNIKKRQKLTGEMHGRLAGTVRLDSSGWNKGLKTGTGER